MKRQEMISLPAILDDGVRRQPGAAALVFRGRRITWPALADAAALLAELLGKDLLPGAVVGLLLPNRPEFVAAFFAIAGRNGTAVLIDPRAGTSEAERIFTECRVEALVTDHTLFEPLRGVVDRCADLRTVILAGDRDAAGAFEFERLTDRVGGRGEAVSRRGETFTICQYTSGVSGYPKIIQRTAEQLLEEIVDFSSAIRLTGQDRVCCVPPLHHSYGLMTGLLAPFHAGAEVLLRDGFLPGPVLEDLSAGVTVFIGVPYFYQLFLRTHLDHSPDLSTLRVALSAGAPLDALVASGCRERFGLRIRSLYGLTETGVVAVNRSGDHRDGVGRPLHGTTVEVVDQEGRSVEDGTEGEIVVTSRAAATEYLHLPEVSREAFCDGRFHSGDLGRRDAGGQLHISGRLKTLINVSGNKVDPGEVENTLVAHPQISDVAVVGCPHPSFGETVKAVLVTEVPVERTEITRFCQERLAGHKVPSIIEFVDQLPRSATGKVLKNDLISPGR